MKIKHLFDALWHHLFHRYANHMLERAPGEVFLRCEKCGLRSPGLTTGPLRLASALEGDPERHRLARVPAPIPPAVLDVAVEVQPDLMAPWEEKAPRSVRVH